ncbi:unnamed protein product [Prorocentrum cordatum]|uniref:Uncharacterized protein n=1 Tax=Prorocentrum cordatum TaxID=2364126 RepID=A0ABN9TTB0_9DINO|nr:unnamed protein product [Polarella glacialis]
MAPAPDCSRNCRKGMMIVALGIATLARAAVRVAEADQGSGLPADSKEASCDAELLDDTDSQKTSLLQQSRAFVLDQGVQRQAAQQAPAPPNSTRAAKVQLYGSSQCQCIGINSEGTMKISVNGTTLDYPRATGSSCQAWDSQRHPDCQSSSSPSWCRSSWCYVDAASCDLRGAQAPEVSLYLQDARFQGRQLYYSYATCGSTDTWTADRHVERLLQPEGGGRLRQALVKVRVDWLDVRREGPRGEHLGRSGGPARGIRPGPRAARALASPASAGPLSLGLTADGTRWRILLM